MERTIVEGQPHRVALDRGREHCCINLVLRYQEPGQVADSLHLDASQIAGHHLGSPLECLVGVAAESASQIEDAFVRVHIQAAIVDGEHQ